MAGSAIRGTWGLAIAASVALVAMPAGSATAAKKAPKRANLVVSSLTAVPAASKGGLSFRVNETTANRGSATARKSSTGAYLSTDKAKGLGDTRLSSQVVPALRVRKSARAKMKIVLPSFLSKGSYYLILCADDGSKVKESSETDNCRAYSRPVKVAAGPDAPRNDPPPVPQITSVNPTSPANTPNVTVKGTARADVIVDVFANSTCTGARATYGTAAQFAAGVSVTVPRNATTR